MKIKEFTENAQTLLSHGVYYDEDGFEAPHQVKQISHRSILVEFFNPEDTFILTVERRDGKGQS